jgi:hypothetical protein
MRAGAIAKRIDELGGKRSEAVKQVAQEFGVSVPTVWRNLAFVRANPDIALLAGELDPTDSAEKTMKRWTLYFRIIQDAIKK